MAAGAQSGGYGHGPTLSEPVHAGGIRLDVQGNHERPAHEAGETQVHGRRPQAALQIRRSRQEND